MNPSRLAPAAIAAAALALLAGGVAFAVIGGDAEEPSAAERGTPLGGGSTGSAGAAPDVAVAEPMPMPIVSSDPRPGPDGSGSMPAQGITVTGTAVVEATPDRSEWSFGVQEQGETARQALDRAAEAATGIVAALRRQGVAERDLRTDQVSVWPNYDGRGSSGYVASTSVRTLVRDLGRASAVVDAAVTAGANQVSGPGLAASDRDAHYRQALAAALDQARANAQALAQRAGTQLGAVVAIRESGSSSPPAYEAAVAADEARAAMPIQPGRQEISASVVVTFAIGG